MPPLGALFTQPALAATLRRLVEADAQAPGPRTAGIVAARARFYRGDVAAMIGAFSERLGGLLRASDLAGYRARLEAPARSPSPGARSSASRHGRRGRCSCKPSACSPRFDLRALGHNSAPYIHAVAEALKLAFADRERYYGDPEHASCPWPSCSRPPTRGGGRR